MEQSKIKRYAAYLEIYILICLAIFLIGKTSLQYHVEDLKKTNKEAAGLMGKNPSTVLNKGLTTKIKPVFKKFTGFLTPIFKIFSKVLNFLKKGINRLRSMLSPIRDFFYKMTKSFFDKIQRFTIGVLYTLHKMRNTMRRTLSGFNLIYHTMEHQKNMLESVVKSPPVRAAVELIKPVEWIGDMFKKLMSPPPPACFIEDTPIQLLNGRIKLIKEIDINDILSDGSEIIAVHKFINHGDEDIYNYKNVFVTGDHLVSEYNKWIPVKNSLLGYKSNLKTEFLYCISCTSGRLYIKNVLFKDYSESKNKLLNFTVNSLVLLDLNKYKFNPEVYSNDNKYLEHCFCSETMIEMNNSTLKRIKDIKLGDKLKNNNQVVGYIRFKPSIFDFYEDNNVLVSSNMKILENEIWKNVEKSRARKVTYKPREAYNLVTSDNTIPIFIGKEYRDYTETADVFTNRNIEQIVSID
jgi:hypothetical protein